MRDEPLPVGVVGVGTMGKHHARVYEAIPEADLVGVTDRDSSAARKTAEEYGTNAYDLEALLERVQAVTIAVPTESHLEVATQCLEAGIDVLVEKPIAGTIAEGEQLIEEANVHDAILQVGHIERYNPAVQALQDFVGDLDIVSIRTERLGPSPDRSIEDSAVLDLMIHDIDIVLSLLGETPETVSAAGVRQNRHASATLTFGSDVIAELTASRLTQEKVRKLEVIATDCLVRVDYLDRDIEIHRQSRPEYITTDYDVRFRHESIIERPMVDSTEPLVNELSAFVDSVRNRSAPEVTGEDALQALQLAKQIDTFRVDEQDPTERRFPVSSEVTQD